MCSLLVFIIIVTKNNIREEGFFARDFIRFSHHGGENMGKQFMSWWTGSRVEQSRNRRSQGNIKAPRTCDILQPGPTFHSSTTSRPVYLNFKSIHGFIISEPS
jgi:hypothetical protein